MPCPARDSTNSRSGATWTGAPRWPSRRNSGGATQYEERHLFLARLGDDSPAGLCSVTLPLRENTAYGGNRRAGGARLPAAGTWPDAAAACRSLARSRGRTSLDGYHEVPLGSRRPGGATVPAKSGCRCAAAGRSRPRPSPRRPATSLNRWNASSRLDAARCRRRAGPVCGRGHRPGRGLQPGVAGTIPALTDLVDKYAALKATHEHGRPHRRPGLGTGGLGSRPGFGGEEEPPRSAAVCSPWWQRPSTAGRVNWLPTRS